MSNVLPQPSAGRPSFRIDMQADLFRHVSVEKAMLYRGVMETFAAAKRQFRLHLRPDEVLAEGPWDMPAPRIEEIQAALAQLTEWGNLESQPDTARVASITDFYRARFLYRLSQGGEAVEATRRTRPSRQSCRGDLGCATGAGDEPLRTRHCRGSTGRHPDRRPYMTSDFYEPITPTRSSPAVCWRRRR